LIRLPVLPLNPLARARRQRLPLWQAWLLALTLLGAQGLGWWHGLAHGQGLPPMAVAALAQGDGAGAEFPWFADHEAGSASCRLLDPLAPDALVVHALALPQVPPVALARALRAEAPRVQSAPCVPPARAPPGVARV
jgi:hypothetical protein